MFIVLYMDLWNDLITRMINSRPDFAIAWSNLAGICKDEGDIKTAISYYSEAIRLCPHFADAHSNLGNALKESGRLDEAEASYRQGIHLRPDFAIAWGNLASVMYDRGDLDNAIRTYRHAIQLEPNFPDAYNNLGNAVRELGRRRQGLPPSIPFASKPEDIPVSERVFPEASPEQLLEEAINCYRTALGLKPDHPHAYNNLGNALKDKGLIKEAAHCYVTACKLMPSFAAAHSNLASLLKEQGKLDQAIAHYREAIAIDPMFARGYSNLGNVYKDLGRVDDAVKCYLSALQIDPNLADAYANLGSAYKDTDKQTEAISCYHKALELCPEFPDAFCNLVHTMCVICDWSSREKDWNKMKAIIEQQLASPNPNVLPSVQPFHSLAYDFSMEAMLQIARRYAERARQSVALLDMPPFRYRARKPRQRIRLGYVSSDFGNHPLSHLMQNVFGMHDRDVFEVFCYALSPDDSTQWRRTIMAGAEHFKDISSLNAPDSAKLIHADGIHILVNLNGYTKGGKNEIFALRPAPIQVSYMGFCGSMGSDYIDFIVADHVVLPPEHVRPETVTESVVYMPHSYFVTDHKQSFPEIMDESRLPSRSKYNLPQDKFIFANFGQLYKIDPQVF